MERKEKIYKICCMIMCFMPFLSTVISTEISISVDIKKFIWAIIFGVDIILILVGLKVFKNSKRYERILGWIVLILLITYTIYFVLKP